MFRNVIVVPRQVRLSGVSAEGGREMFLQTITLNKQVADNVEKDYRNFVTTEEISEKYNIPKTYIGVILRSRDVPLTRRRREPKKYKKEENGNFGAQLKESDEKLLQIIMEYPQVKLFKGERIKDIVFARLGIGRDEALTYREVGKQFGISHERVRQLYEGAAKTARFRVGAYKANLTKQENKEQFSAPIVNNSQNAEKETYAYNPQSVYNDVDVLLVSGLSIRAFNGLRRAGIEYVEDLCKMKESELLKIRCLGQTSLKDIIYHLNKHGLSLRSDND